jgi:hypothetical protein
MKKKFENFRFFLPVNLSRLIFWKKITKLSKPQNWKKIIKIKIK